MKALFSVSDKTGVVEFASQLVDLGWEIIATGGTMKLLQDAGLKVINISEITGFPEICDGRVKTLHPKVHGGLLGRRDLDSHIAQLKENGIEFIDMVCVNLYPFKQTIAKPDVTMEDAIENIDIGGPSMLAVQPRTGAQLQLSATLRTMPRSSLRSARMATQQRRLVSSFQLRLTPTQQSMT